MSPTPTCRLRVVEGGPWTEALICALAQGTPYRPWHGAEAVEPGDTVIVVLVTDPRTVLCTFKAGHGSVPEAIAAQCRTGSSLPTVEDIELAAGGHLLIGGLAVESSPAAALIAAASKRRVSEPADRVGSSSAAGARILMASRGRCTHCGAGIDLTRTPPSDLNFHLVTDTDFREGRDWPALLCGGCAERMSRGRFRSVIDYAHSLHPACPACSAMRTRQVVYGKLGYDGFVNMPPWKCSGGCAVGSQGRWVCGECGHRWGSASEQQRFGSDPRRNEAARKLFAEWTGVTNPELLAALWNNLNVEDRQYWLNRVEIPGR